MIHNEKGVGHLRECVELLAWRSEQIMIVNDIRMEVVRRCSKSSGQSMRAVHARGRYGTGVFNAVHVAIDLCRRQLRLAVHGIRRRAILVVLVRAMVNVCRAARPTRAVRTAAVQRGRHVRRAEILLDVLHDQINGDCNTAAKGGRTYRRCPRRAE